MKRLIGLSWMLISAAAWAADGVIEISQADLASPPYVISQSGSYMLTENLVVTNTDVNGIEVRAHHVTLDLNGFMLKGPGAGHSSSNGVQQLAGYENLAVRRGSVLDWANGSGISAVGTGTVLEDLCVTRNLTGIYILNHGMIRNSMICTNLTDGIDGGWSSSISSSVQVVHCVVSGNGEGGIMADTKGAWQVQNCQCDYNQYNGIYLGQASIRDSSASYNHGDGMVVGQGSITHCTADQNTNIGIRCNGSILGSVARLNGGVGIYGDGVIRGCRAEYNKGEGFHVAGAITDCSAYENEYLGFYVDIRSRIQGCHAESNEDAGIYLRYSSLGTYSTAEDNVMAGNDYGLLCDQAYGNIIVRNKALNNDTNYWVGTGNSFAEVLSPGMAFSSSNAWANFSD